MWMAMAFAEEVHEQGVVPAGVFGQLVLVLAADDGGGDGLVDHGEQAHHEAVVGGADDGGVELPVGGGTVLVLADALVYGLAAGENFFHFLRGGPLAGQAGGGRLEDGSQLEEVPQFAADLI